MNNKNGKKTIKQQEVFDVIRSLVGQSHVLTIPRAFIDFTGDIPSALLLAQLVYWSERATRSDGYVWKTYQEWEQELSLNKYHINKAANNLKKMGLLKTVVRKAGGNPTLHYLLLQEEFLKSFVQFLNKRKYKNQTNDSPKIGQTINTEYVHKIHTKKVSEVSKTLATLLKSLILENNTMAKVPGSVDGWAMDIERMINLDKRPPEIIEEVIRFSQSSDFWRSHILSPNKLSDKFDTLTVQANGGNRHGTETTNLDKW